MKRGIVLTFIILLVSIISLFSLNIVFANGPDGPPFGNVKAECGNLDKGYTCSFSGDSCLYESGKKLYGTCANGYRCVEKDGKASCVQADRKGECKDAAGLNLCPCGSKFACSSTQNCDLAKGFTDVCASGYLCAITKCVPIKTQNDIKGGCGDVNDGWKCSLPSDQCINSKTAEQKICANGYKCMAGSNGIIGCASVTPNFKGYCGVVDQSWSCSNDLSTCVNLNDLKQFICDKDSYCEKWNGGVRCTDKKFVGDACSRPEECLTQNCYKSVCINSCDPNGNNCINENNGRVGACPKYYGMWLAPISFSCGCSSSQVCRGPNYNNIVKDLNNIVKDGCSDGFDYESKCANGYACKEDPKTGQGSCEKNPSCKNENDCKPGEMCKNNFCVENKCGNVQACPDPGSYICDSGKCVKAECFVDAGCNDGKMCDNYKCVNKQVKCKLNNDCKSGEWCAQDGFCYSSCKNGVQVSLDCPNAMLCDNSVCKWVCTKDDMCPLSFERARLGQTCKIGMGKPICDPMCYQDVDCIDHMKDGKCENNKCVNKQVEQCVKASDCSNYPDEGCKNGVCTVCTINSDCDPGQICDLAAGGQCRDCNDDTECGKGLVCDSGKCAKLFGNQVNQVCFNDGNCVNGQLCDNKLCVDSQIAMNSLNKICCGYETSPGNVGYNWKTRMECKGLSGNVNDESSCPKQQDCKVDLDCVGSQKCENNKCSDKLYGYCKSNGDCGRANICVNNECAWPCVNNNDCPPLTSCLNGGCFVNCVNDKDCWNGGVCVEKSCKNPLVNKLKDANELCVDNKECKSGKCEQVQGKLEKRCTKPLSVSVTKPLSCADVKGVVCSGTCKDLNGNIKKTEKDTRELNCCVGVCQSKEQYIPTLGRSIKFDRSCVPGSEGVAQVKILDGDGKPLDNEDAKKLGVPGNTYTEQDYSCGGLQLTPKDTQAQSVPGYGVFALLTSFVLLFVFYFRKKKF